MRYKVAEDVYDDLTLVMLNAEFYNEEGSQIWKDAATLKVCSAIQIGHFVLKYMADIH